MANPQIQEIRLLEQSGDHEGRLTRQYQVWGPGIDCYTVFTAYDSTGQRLPQEGDPNPLQVLAGDTSNASKADRFSSSQSGSKEGNYPVIDVTIEWVRPDEVSEALRQGSEGNFKYPWDQPTDFNITSGEIEEDLYGADGLGNPMVYSNDELINLKRINSLTVFDITRNRKTRGDSFDNSIKMSDDFKKKVNNGPVQLIVEGVLNTFATNTLLVESFEVALIRLKTFDPITNDPITIPYFQERIRLIHKKNTWATRVADEGNFEMSVLADGTTKVYRRITNSDQEPYNVPQSLNGSGKQLLANTHNNGLRDILTPWANNATTSQGVPIDVDMTQALSGRLVVLALLTYEQADFSGMDLNRGLTN